MTALVNAGALFTIIPSSTLTRLGITPFDTRAYILPDGNRLKRTIGYALANINGHEAETIVEFGADDAQPLLGSYTLEGLGLEVDEANSQIVERPYMFAATPIAVDPIKPPAKQESR